MKGAERPPEICALVVDDEAPSRSNLMVLLKRHPEIAVVGECASGVAALEAIRNARPHLVFLDVEMPECDGFDVIERLGPQVPPAIVFVTAYDAYALRAFEAGALDYLLKPFDDARFERALARAKDRIAQHRATPIDRDVFVVKNVSQIAFLKISEIDWIEAADYYCRLHLGTKTHLLRRSIADLERKLDPAASCRIHRSTIVKLDRVAGLALNENGEYDVLLNDGTKLRTSRRYRTSMRSALNRRALASS